MSADHTVLRPVYECVEQALQPYFEGAFFDAADVIRRKSISETQMRNPEAPSLRMSSRRGFS